MGVVMYTSQVSHGWPSRTKGNKKPRARRGGSSGPWDATALAVGRADRQTSATHRHLQLVQLVCHGSVSIHSGLCGFDGQAHGHRRAVAYGALDVDRAAVLLQDAPHSREA